MALNRNRWTRPFRPACRESFIQIDIFEGLVHPGPDGTLRPGVAESWQVSDDGLTYTFKLRPDAVWSDGSPLTAKDFIYSWARMVDPATASNYAFILWPIKNAELITKGELTKDELAAEAVDDHTLKVTLRAPTAYFLQMLMHHSAYPVPRQAIEKFGRGMDAAGQYRQQRRLHDPGMGAAGPYQGGEEPQVPRGRRCPDRHGLLLSDRGIRHGAEAVPRRRTAFDLRRAAGADPLA